MDTLQLLAEAHGQLLAALRHNDMAAARRARTSYNRLALGLELGTVRCECGQPAAFWLRSPSARVASCEPCHQLHAEQDAGAVIEPLHQDSPLLRQRWYTAYDPRGMRTIIAGSGSVPMIRIAATPAQESVSIDDFVGHVAADAAGLVASAPLLLLAAEAYIETNERAVTGGYWSGYYDEIDERLRALKDAVAAAKGETGDAEQ